MRQAELLRHRRVRVERTWIGIVRAIAVRAPHPLERERVAVEHDDAAVTVAVGHEDLVVGRVHGEIGRPAHVGGVGAALAHAGLAELLEELPLLRELQDLMILGAVARQPDDVLVVHEYAVLGLRPVVPGRRTTP